MAYLLSILAFLGTFFVLLLLSVLMVNSVGIGSGMYINALIAFAISRLVYVKTKPKRAVDDNLDDLFVDETIGLSKLEKKDFSKVFTSTTMENLKIQKIAVTIQNDDFDFTIHFKCDSFDQLDIDQVRKALSKRFYHVEKINLIEFNDADVTIGDFSISSSSSM